MRIIWRRHFTYANVCAVIAITVIAGSEIATASHWGTYGSKDIARSTIESSDFYSGRKRKQKVRPDDISRQSLGKRVFSSGSIRGVRIKARSIRSRHIKPRSITTKDLNKSQHRIRLVDLHPEVIAAIEANSTGAP